METPGRIIFELNGHVRTVEVLDPSQTLLSYLRSPKVALMGTKEGTCSGGTGTSTVILSVSSNGATTRHRPISSSVFPLVMCHGTAITTVEGVGSHSKGTLSRLQKILADESAFQCGYCCSGYVASLACLLGLKHTQQKSRGVGDAMRDHLCRCSGYRSIHAAATKAYADIEACVEMSDLLSDVPLAVVAAGGETVSGPNWCLPSSLEDATAFLEKHRDVRVVGGGIYLEQQRQLLDGQIGPYVLFAGRMHELEYFRSDSNRMYVGAASPIEEFCGWVQQQADSQTRTQALALLERFGNLQTRSVVTMAGAMKGLRRGLLPVMAALNGVVKLSDGSTLPVAEWAADSESEGLVVEVSFDWPCPDDNEGQILIGYISDRVTMAQTVSAVAMRGEAVWGLGGVVLENGESRDLHEEAALEMAKTGGMSRLGPLELETEYVWPESQHEYVGKPLIDEEKEYARVSGETLFSEDIVLPPNGVYGAFVYSTRAHAKILKVDLSVAQAMAEYVDFVDVSDIKGVNQLTGIPAEDGYTDVFAAGVVKCVGHAIGLVLATSQAAARRAAQSVEVEYEDLVAYPDILSANEAGSWFDMIKSNNVERGNVEFLHDEAKRGQDVVFVEGKLHVGSQEHLYFEKQNTTVYPDEPCMIIRTSSQNASKVQADVAKVLAIGMHSVIVRVNVIGGGFGGKQDRPCFIACAAALAAQKLRRPVQIVLDRDTDMLMSGGRHEQFVTYKAAATRDGDLLGAELQILMDGGSVFDVTGPVMDKSLFQSESVYHWPNWAAEARGCKTNRVTPTAFRGFGAPQAVITTETIISHLAKAIGMEVADFRQKNFVTAEKGTAVGCYLEKGFYPDDKCPVRKMFAEMRQETKYDERKVAAEQFNHTSTRIKRGVALVPQKCAVIFEVDFMNCGHALVHIYNDGTVFVSHGAVEMGQKVHTKMRAIAAQALDCDIALVKIADTATDRCPNTQPTAASSGADLNGPAVKRCCEILKERLDVIRRDIPDLAAREKWCDLIGCSYFNPKYRTDLSAEARVCLPQLNWDFHQKGNRNVNGTGFVGHYYSFGVGFAEVEVDTLTGKTRILDASVVQDAGMPLNPMVDIHQCEGAYTQGTGLFIYEEQKRDPSTGEFLNRSAHTYLIPGVDEVPRKFRMHLTDLPNEGAIHNSKATGEGPMNNSVSVPMAVRHALGKEAEGDQWRFTPITAEALRELL